MKADCPAGKVVLGGGFRVSPMVGKVEYSRPDIDGSGWEIYVVDLGANTPTVDAWAVCADVN